MRRASFLGVITAAVVFGPRARPGGPAPASVVRVTGVVYDSLLGAPLAGAVVTRAGAPALTLTDSAGHFALDSVPASPGRFVVSHPGLDSAGLSDVPVAVDLSGTRDSAVVALTTPSRTTLRARLCAPAGAAPAADGGVVFGEVRDALDAAGAAQIAGAEATVAWLAVRDRRGALMVPRPDSRAARADAAGGWALCDLPLGVPLEVRAAVPAGGGGPHPRASGRALVTLGSRGVARVDVWVGADPGAPTPAAVVTGTVRDTAGLPLAGVRVAADEVDGAEGRTDVSGRFRLAGVPLGTRTLLVRAVGYPPATAVVAVRAGAAAVADVTLRRTVALPRVVVRARAPRLDRYAADVARRRAHPRGYFADTAEVHARGARWALGRLPVGVVGGDDGDWGVSFARLSRAAGGRPRSCLASVYVDGTPTEWRRVPWLDQRRIAAIEVYQDGLTAPAEFTNGGCGVVLFWTDAIR